MSNVWMRLLLYESRDLVSRLYNERHGRQISVEKAQEIGSYLAQGREYFEAANDAGELVQPLLQYYGALSLARGLILFLQPVMRELALKPAHGMAVTGWEGMTAADIAKLPQLGVRLEGGSLLELFTATKNAERGTISREPTADELFPTEKDLIRYRVSTDVIGFEVTVKELLARIPSLSELYEETFQEPSSCYEAEILMRSVDSHTGIKIFPSENQSYAPDELIARLGIPKGTFVRHLTRHDVRDDAPHCLVRLDHASEDQLVRTLPPLRRVKGDVGHGDTTYLIEPFRRAVSLSPLIEQLILSYFLGMLVRYHPTLWRLLLTRQKGDYIYPLFRASLDLMRNEFPSLVLAELEDRHATPREAPSSRSAAATNTKSS